MYTCGIASPMTDHSQERDQEECEAQQERPQKEQESPQNEQERVNRQHIVLQYSDETSTGNHLNQ